MNPVQNVTVLRVLCREDLGISGATTFADDVERTMEWLTLHPIQTPEKVRPFFGCHLALTLHPVLVCLLLWHLLVSHATAHAISKPDD